MNNARTCARISIGTPNHAHARLEPIYAQYCHLCALPLCVREHAGSRTPLDADAEFQLAGGRKLHAAAVLRHARTASMATVVNIKRSRINILLRRAHANARTQCCRRCSQKRSAVWCNATNRCVSWTANITVYTWVYALLCKNLLGRKPTDMIVHSVLARSDSSSVTASLMPGLSCI